MNCTRLYTNCTLIVHQLVYNCTPIVHFLVSNWHFLDIELCFFDLFLFGHFNLNINIDIYQNTCVSKVFNASKKMLNFLEILYFHLYCHLKTSKYSSKSVLLSNLESFKFCFAFAHIRDDTLQHCACLIILLR